MEAADRLRQWHRLTLDFGGPSAGETAGLEVGHGALEKGRDAGRLYMGNGWSGTAEPGGHNFDEAIEDTLILDDLDLSADFGDQVDGMFEWPDRVSDATVDFNSVDEIENRAINAVEIIRIEEVSPPAPQVSVLDAAVDEGGGSVFVTFETDRTVPLTEDVTVNFEIVADSAAPLDDYASELTYANGVYSGTFEIVGGSAVRTLAIDILQDDVVEGEENFTIEITSVHGAGATVGDGIAHIAISDDDGDEDDPCYVDGGGASEGMVVYRWNAGTETIAAVDGGPDWVADGEAVVGSTRIHTGPGVGAWTLDAGLPDTTPADIFAQERWGSSASVGMGLEFGGGALEAGRYAVRLYMGNGWSGTKDPGERIFSVSVEQRPFLDDLDLSAALGHRVGGMFEWQGTVEDGMIDVDFDHIVENPLINAVEILCLGAEMLM